MINFRELISCSDEHCFEFVWFGPRPVIEIIKWTLIARPERQRRQFCAKTTVLYIAIGNKPEFGHFVFLMCLTILMVFLPYCREHFIGVARLICASLSPAERTAVNRPNSLGGKHAAAPRLGRFLSAPAATVNDVKNICFHVVDHASSQRS